MKMNKKLVSAIAVASAAVLACTPVFAASSSTTTNTDTTTAKTETTTSVVVSTKTAAIVGNGTAIATTDGARISGSKAQLSDKKVVTTVKQTVVNADTKAANADNTIAQALMSYVDTVTPNASKVFGPYKYQFYKAGVSIDDGFGTYATYFGVGNAYEGKTAIVYQIMKDGSVTATQVTVNNGKIAYDLTKAGTVTVVFQ